MLLRAPDFSSAIRPLGRCRADGELLWFNWSCSGFALRFCGKSLRAKLIAVEQDMTAPFEHEPIMMRPVVGITADGGEMRRVKLENGEQWLELFSGGDGEHCLTLRKLSENVMGKCALAELETDGEFLPPPEAPPLRIEFIGDSITCGYGNESEEPGLRTEHENGAAAYGFLAAEMLGADYSAISVSGCGVPESIHPGLGDRGMLNLFPFTDAPLDRMLGREAEKWDFAAHPCAAAVLNLGTNDSAELAMQDFTPEALERFINAYRSLLEDMRRRYGPETWLICVLGPMDYYLWDEIRDIVSSFAEGSGDSRIAWAKLGRQDAMKEGLGSDGHPSAAAHRRMAAELCRIIKENTDL